MNQFDTTSAVVNGEIELFRALWHDSFDSMFIVQKDADGHYVIEKTNRAQEKTFHLEPNQLAGCKLVDILEPPVFTKISGRYDECLDKGHPISYEEIHEIDDTGIRYWNTLILPVVCQQTGEKRIFGISREITSLKRAERVLQEANEALEKKVEERTKALTEALAEMERISYLDKLTGLCNRHKLDEVLLSEHTLAERYDSTFGVLLLDLDNFKDINDDFGHHQGDGVLKKIGNILNARSRQTDTVGRWGGDEFLIVVPYATEETLTGFAKQLKTEIEQHDFGCNTRLTSSFGVATYQEGDSLDSLVHRADKALYESKSQGKNKVIFK